MSMILPPGLILETEEIPEDLSGLLGQLSEQTAGFSTLLSDGIRSELLAAEQTAIAAHKRYVSAKAIIDELRQLLAEQHSDDPPVRLGGALRTLDSLMSSAMLQERIESEQGGGLFHLDQIDAGEGAETEMSVRQKEMRSVILPLLAVRLRARCEALASFCDSRPGMSFGFGKTSPLPTILREKQERLKKLRLENQDARRQRLLEAVKLEKVQVEMLDVLGRLVHEFKLKEQPRSDDIRRSELVAYTQAQVLKVARLRDELRKDTYNQSTVPALAQVRLMLDAELARAADERDSLKERMRQYESLGPAFERVAAEYRSVKEQLREKQWALSQVDFE